MNASIPARVLAAVLALLAVTAIAFGGFLVAIHSTHRDSHGFYASGEKTLTTPTYALVADEIDFGTGGFEWLFRKNRLGTVRVTATGTAAKPIFVGIAPRTRIDAYLRGVATDKISDIEADPFSITYSRQVGAAKPAAPTGLTFWTSKASGAGLQTLTWPVQQGEWAILVMNADGSRGVRTGVSVGAKLGYLLWAGIGLLIGGGLMATGAVAIWLGGRRQAAEGVPISAPVIAGT